MERVLVVIDFGLVQKNTFSIYTLYTNLSRRSDTALLDLYAEKTNVSTMSRIYNHNLEPLGSYYVFIGIDYISRYILR